MTIREKHGIADAKKLPVANEQDAAVVVTDGVKSVLLSVSIDQATAVVGLTPEQARFIAQNLIEAAQRFEARE